MLLPSDRFPLASVSWVPAVVRQSCASNLSSRSTSSASARPPGGATPWLCCCRW